MIYNTDTTMQDEKTTITLAEGEEIILHDKAQILSAFSAKEGHLTLTTHRIMWTMSDSSNDFELKISDIKRISAPAIIGSAWGQWRMDVTTTEKKIYTFMLSKTSEGKAYDKVRLIKDFVRENLGDKKADVPVNESNDVKQNEARMALSLVLDVSLSMQGTSINSLTSAINKMIGQMKKDFYLSKAVDLAIFVYGTHNRRPVHQGFRTVADWGTVALEAVDQDTYIVKTLERSLEIIQKRSGIYDKTGSSHEPWIVIVTGGELNDDISAICRIGDVIKERERQGKLQLLALGTNGYKRKQLEMLTSTPDNVIEVKVDNFDELFSEIARRIRTQGDRLAV